MTPKIATRDPSLNRRQSGLLTRNDPPPVQSRLAEVAGGTTKIATRDPSLNRRQSGLLTTNDPHRRQSGLLTRNDPPPPVQSRLAEVAGGTTAEVASVCCCCPCIVANFLVLSVYKIPAGLCREALKKNKMRRKQLKTAGFIPRHKNCVHPVDLLKGDSNAEESNENEKEVMELEKEMWEKFQTSGFWRSPSQKD